MMGAYTACILCADERLCRLLEIELEYLGMTATSFSALPLPESIDLVVWDCDLLPARDAEAYARGSHTPLLLFAREAASLPPPRRDLICLRRPFALTELNHALRRLSGDIPSPPAPHTPPIGHASAAPVLSVRDGMVTVDGHTVALTASEWAILSLLCDRQGSAVSREELSALLDGGGNSVDVYICRLRAKIEKPLGRRMIHTVRGVGYQLDPLE